MLDAWCQECSLESQESECRVSWEFIKGQGGSNDGMKHAITPMDGSINPWYNHFTEAMSQMNLEFTPEVFPAATDSRFLRALGIRALGFSPMRNSEIMLHENDEYLLTHVFLEGISVYIGIIQSLASQPRQLDEIETQHTATCER